MRTNQERRAESQDLTRKFKNPPLEIRNKEGTLICSVYTETGKNLNEERTVIDTLVIESPTGERIDFYEFMGLPKDVKVLVEGLNEFDFSDERSWSTEPQVFFGQTNHFNFEKQEIIVNGIHSPVQLGILAHEIGHAIQSEDPKFRILFEKGFDRKPDSADINNGDTLEFVQRSVEVGRKFSDSLIKELVDLSHEFENKSQDVRKLGNDQDRIRKKIQDLTVGFLQNVFEQPDTIQEQGITVKRAYMMDPKTYQREQLDAATVEQLLTEVRSTGQWDVQVSDDGVVTAKAYLKDRDTEKTITIDLLVDLEGVEDPFAQAAQDALGEFDQITDELYDKSDEQLAVQDKYSELAEPHMEIIKEMLKIPTILLERNATARALKALRALKQKHNIDLVEAFDSVELLQNCLSTYSAESAELQEKFGRIPFIPEKKPQKAV